MKAQSNTPGSALTGGRRRQGAGVARLVAALATLLPLALLPASAVAAQTPGVGPVTFQDVPGNFWAASAIDTLAAKGILQGYPDGKFHPEAVMTRAQFVTALDRLSNRYLSTTGAPTFQDVPPGTWYYQPVEQAAGAGWVHGTNGYFHPYASLTRQDVAVILAQYLNLGNMVQAAQGNPPLSLDFPDASSVAPYAPGALAACQDVGLIQGFPNGLLEPNQPVTRAQAAVMLDRLALIAPQQAASAAGANQTLKYAFVGNASYVYNLDLGGTRSQVDLQETGSIPPGNVSQSNLRLTATEYWQVNGQKTQVAQAATTLTVSGQGRLTGGLGTAKGASLAMILGGQGTPWTPTWDLVIPMPNSPVNWGDTWTAQSNYDPAVTTTYTYLGLAIWQGKPTAVIRIQADIQGAGGAPAGHLTGLAGVRPSDGKLRYVEVQGSQGSTTFSASGVEVPYSPPGP